MLSGSTNSVELCFKFLKAINFNYHQVPHGTKLWQIATNKHFGTQNIGGLAALYSNRSGATTIKWVRPM